MQRLFALFGFLFCCAFCLVFHAAATTIPDWESALPSPSPTPKLGCVLPLMSDIGRCYAVRVRCRRSATRAIQLARCEGARGRCQRRAYDFFIACRDTDESPRFPGPS